MGFRFEVHAQGVMMKGFMLRTHVRVHGKVRGYGAWCMVHGDGQCCGSRLKRLKS